MFPPGRHILVFLSFTLITITAGLHPVSAQQIIDLFPEKRARISAEDTAAIFSLIRTGTRLLITAPDSAVGFFEEAMDISVKKKFPEGVGSALMAIGSYHGFKGDYAGNLNYLRQAKPYLRNAFYKRDYWIALWHQHMGLGYFSGQVPDSAVYHYILAAQVIGQKDTLLLARTYFHLGRTLTQYRQYEQAVYYLHLVGNLLAAPGRRPLHPLLGSIYNMLSIAYEKTGNDSISFDLAQRALAMGRQDSSHRMQLLAYTSLINYYLKHKMPEKAIACAEQMIRLCGKQDNELRSYALWGLSAAYQQMRLYDKAKQYGLSSLAFYRESVSVPLSFSLAELYQHLALVHYALGENKKAYEFQALHTQLLDSMHRLVRNSDMDRLEAQYRIAEQDKKLLLQEAAVRRRDVWIIAVCAGILITIALSVLAFTLYGHSRRKISLLEKQKEIDELKALMQGEEKERKRLAKELHDGVGGLLSAATLNLGHIGEERLTEQQHKFHTKVQLLLAEVSNEVRKTAHNLIPDIILKNDLDQAVKLYCTYIKRDTGLDITVQTQVNALPFEQQFKLSVYRIVQELIQNILKHAQATTAFVQLQGSNDLLTITVEDNGTGFDVHGKHEGLGLSSIRERVAAFKGEILIESSPETGTSTNIEFDLNYIHKFT